MLRGTRTQCTVQKNKQILLSACWSLASVIGLDKAKLCWRKVYYAGSYIRHIIGSVPCNVTGKDESTLRTNCAVTGQFCLNGHVQKHWGQKEKTLAQWREKYGSLLVAGPKGEKELFLYQEYKNRYSETNVVHFLFSLLGIKGLYMLRALLAHLQEALYKTALGIKWIKTNKIR
jgi:hypothetical protein